MAIPHFSVSVGKVGQAVRRAAYFCRLDNRGWQSSPERLEATGTGNMPLWATDNASAFWKAADTYERKRGTTFRQFIGALPRELSVLQRRAVLIEFVAMELGTLHPFQWAIHNTRAADSREQPHFHLMFSERRRDQHERDPEQFFKRFNSRRPHFGGCRKGFGLRWGERLNRTDRSADLKALRLRWEALVNRHLEEAGRRERIDLRSHAEQGCGATPEPKHNPGQWRQGGRERMIDWRLALEKYKAAASRVREEVAEYEEVLEGLGGGGLAGNQNELLGANAHRDQHFLDRGG